jgi:hypothetical protein
LRAGSQIGSAAIWGLIYTIIGQDFLNSCISLVAVLGACLWIAPQFWWIFVPPIPAYILLTRIFAYGK